MKIHISTKHLPLDDYEICSPGCYVDGSMVIEIRSPDSDAIEMKATVCVLDHTPPIGSVMIKNWSENEGILESLIAADVIYPPTRKIRCSEHVNAYECKVVGSAQMQFKYL